MMSVPLLMLCIVSQTIAIPYRAPDRKVEVTYHWQRRSVQCQTGKREERTDCAVKMENRYSDYGSGCYDEFLPAVRNIRNLCPLMCKGADTADVLSKWPTNNHRCAQFFNYGIHRVGDQMYLWRSGKCLEATIRFDVRCGFPFNPQEFQVPNDDLFSLL